MDVINLIKENEGKIFNKLYEDKRSFDHYNYILTEFKTGNIVNNKEFKKIYKKFYVLNRGGLGPKLIDRYFELLEKRETNLRKILRELSKIPRRKGDYAVELSFASKLVHTVDNNQPIFDKNVTKVFGIKLNYNIKNIDERIENRLRAYDLLKKEFNEVLADQEVKEIVKRFKGRLKVNIGDVKMLDFMLWKLGEMIIK